MQCASHCQVRWRRGEAAMADHAYCKPPAAAARAVRGPESSREDVLYAHLAASPLCLRQLRHRPNIYITAKPVYWTFISSTVERSACVGGAARQIHLHIVLAAGCRKNLSEHGQNGAGTPSPLSETQADARLMLVRMMLRRKCMHKAPFL